MFLPYFIAILLGFVSPSNTNSNCTHNGGTTVSTNNNTPGDPGDPGDDGTGGDTGQNPPR
ncbi:MULTISPECIES: hypothetical protein [unclassified Pedobacter]|uniref:hypothetical protein n=1 Tax=unclassified Pedobacter TaxID=2628915 RepID=UPI00224683D5|nr:MULTISPECIES: hypothetical protein [unclassified Pedobacter]MCX2432211.1 hypothetical protein [Pedobacter sp. GR22-10]MCX2582745.1 hypothetical protein [Pedobacter sp. MR22-3]